MEHKPLSRKRKRDHGGAEVDDEKSRATRFLGSEDSTNSEEDRSSTDSFSRDDDEEEAEGRPTEAVLSLRQSNFLHSLCNVNEDSSDITIANLRVIGLASFWEGGFPFDYSSSEEEDDVTVTVTVTVTLRVLSGTRNMRAENLYAGIWN